MQSESCFVWFGNIICPNNNKVEKFKNTGYTLKNSSQLCGNKNTQPLIPNSKCYNYKPDELEKNGNTWCKLKGQTNGNTVCYGAWDNTTNTNYTGGCSKYAGSNANISYLCGPPITSFEQFCKNNGTNSKCYNYITQQNGNQWCQIKSVSERSLNNTCYGAWDVNEKQLYTDGCNKDAGPNANIEYLCGPQLNLQNLSKNKNFNASDSSLSYKYRIEDTWQDGLRIPNVDLGFAVLVDTKFRFYMLTCLKFRIQYTSKTGAITSTPLLKLDYFLPTAWFGNKDVVKFSLFDQQSQSSTLQIQSVNVIKSYTPATFIFYFK